MTRRRSRGRPQDQAQAAEPAWRRIDLHIHTPGSVDYQEPRATYLDILQKAEARGLDIIAFTDHNSVAGYAAMLREIEHLEFLEASDRLQPDEARRLGEYRRLRERVLVLPGFEFTATFGFHILGIFPEQTSVRKLEHVLLALNIPEEKLDRGTSEVGATADVLRAYQVIADAGGLVIAAHVNSTHGVAMIGLGFGGQTKIAYTQDPNLHALEVTDLESTSRRATARFFNGSKPEYARRMHCIQGSDAHRVTRDPERPEKNLGVGDRCTEVLLPEVGFAALKALFASTDFGRTRPYRPSEDPFDPLTAAREEGNTIVQAFHETPGVPRAPVKGLLKDIVAFANTNGGVLYVGASAGPGAKIAGVDNATELAHLIRAEAARQVVPPLQPDVELLTSDGKTVLVVTVPRGTDTPYALDPGYIYVRQEGETALALRDEIVQLVRASLEQAPAGIEATTPAAPAPRPATEPPARPDGRGARPQPAGPQESQQAAVRQATAAEQERQQERTPVPRTGVEIIASTERDGVIYHTVRDLRNRRAIRNVTRQSARRLWRYAIVECEEHPVRAADVRWDPRDPRFGFWKGYRQPEGMCRYNLVYREPAADGEDERLRVFYGVTEDGMDERWRGVLPPEGELVVVDYDALPAERAPAHPAPEPAPTEPAPATEEAAAEPAAVAAPSVEPEPTPPAAEAPVQAEAPTPGPEAEAAPPAPRQRRTRRRTKAQPAAEQAPAEIAAEAAPPPAEPEAGAEATPAVAAEAVPPEPAPNEPVAASEPVAPEAPPAKSRRRRAPRKAAPADEAAPAEVAASQEPTATESPVAEPPVAAAERSAAAEPGTSEAAATEESTPTRKPARRRRSPRKAAAEAGGAAVASTGPD
ncbi:MAG TPA: RNA-binding domain-containing protein [Thermomicrobiales bacterium]|nr:RNA-binding domain-containing protein [Thermomicrobiales bacterium]